MEKTKKYSILLFDNNEANLDCFQQNLDLNVYSVTQLKDLSLLNNSHLTNGFDMLIIGEDFQKDGQEFIQTIKTTFKLVPILFIVSKHDDSKIIHSLEIGADGIIFTPINPKLMTARIKSFVDKYELLSKRFEEKLQNIRGNLAMVLPHEFRTSVSGIKGLAKTVSQISYEKSYLTKGEILEIFEMSNLIMNSCSYLSRITENILLYSKLQLIKHNHEIDYERDNKLISNPKEVIEEIAFSLTANTEREKDIVLDLDNADLHISQYHFQKIIYELIDNAIKFSDVKSEIFIKAHSTEDKFIITIIDQGRGMSITQISEIDAFKQFDRNIYEQQGNGLGLIIVKELTELHNGSFSVFSQKDYGTRISIEFPNKN